MAQRGRHGLSDSQKRDPAQDAKRAQEAKDANAKSKARAKAVAEEAELEAVKARARAHAEARAAKEAKGGRAREPESTDRAIPFIKLRCGESTGQKGKVLKLVGRRFTFGREHGTVKVPAEVVSRRHAEFKLGRRGWVLRDLHSRNGTFLNGARIESARIRVGNIVTLGPEGAHYQVIALEDTL